MKTEPHVWIIESKSELAPEWVRAGWPNCQMVHSTKSGAALMLESILRYADGTITYRIRKYVRQP